jgi:mono/diheme cytochrome c family protein
MVQRLLAFALAMAASAMPFAAHAATAQTERGKYLVAIAGCGDCHTAGNFLGHPDMTKFLGGSDVGFAVPGLGVFVGPNLTPDKATGLGAWTDKDIVTAITTGKRPDGRMLAPVMPWRDFANLSRPDALAIAAYLKSLPPVSNKVPGPFGPNQTPTVLVFSIQPGPVYAGLPKPPQ